MRWKRAEEKSVSWSTEAVCSPVIGLMEALHFWHLLAEVCFHTFVADTLGLSQTAPSASRSFAQTGDVWVQLWGLWLLRLSRRRLATISTLCFVEQAAAAEERTPSHPVVTERCGSRTFDARLCNGPYDWINVSAWPV